MSEVLIAFCTFPNAEVAEKVANAMVEQYLTACANILPGIRSVYRWQGKVESADEVLAVFKLAASRYAEFESQIRAAHPYEVPEIIAFPVSNGLPAYLEWVKESCS
jgi:periplasmic divalent cation tolerance protein